MASEQSGANAHHQEIVTVALRLLEEALKGKARESVLDKIRTLIDERKHAEGDEAESDHVDNARTKLNAR